MIVLGVNETHCATAALLQDGRIIGCASEERFTRLKNDAGYPRLAIDALLRQCRLTPAQIDLVALAGARAASREWLNRVLHDEAYAKEYYGVSWPSPRRALEKKMRKWGAKFGLIDASRGKFGISQAERLAFVTEHLGIPRERIVCLDHHTCHAAAAYFGSGFAGREALVLPNAPRSDAVRARLPGRLLLLRHPGPRHEVRRARVQGHGHGALRLGEVCEPCRGGAARGIRSRGGHARPLPLAQARRALWAPAPCHPRLALRRGGGGSAAPARGRAAPLDSAHARALRRHPGRPRRRRLHEREGEHAHRPGGVAAGALRLPVVR